MTMAAANDITFAPGRLFYSGSSAQAVNNIRLSFAAVESDRIEAGAEKLCMLIERLKSGGHGHRGLPIL